MPEGAGLRIDSGILVSGVVRKRDRERLMRERMKETYNTVVAVLMRTCQCLSVLLYIHKPR